MSQEYIIDKKIELLALAIEVVAINNETNPTNRIDIHTEWDWLCRTVLGNDHRVLNTMGEDVD